MSKATDMVRCECGLRVSKKNYNSHKRGAKHRDRMEMVDEVIAMEQERLRLPMRCGHMTICSNLIDGKLVCSVCDEIKAAVRKYIRTRYPPTV